MNAAANHQQGGASVLQRGFSVIELIVAIAAIAVITVGVAQIFQTVGDTVSGGRRVSGFTQAANTLESQMRADVARMTRDGFLIIHHQTVNAPLAPGVAGSPARRVDELMFFGRGEFETNRPAVRPDPAFPARVARGTEARFYYGHGVSYESEPARARYQFPAFYDGLSNQPISPITQLGAAGGANDYASDWNLIRLQTLLAQPINAPDVPEYLRDSEYQIAYQPAMGSIFKALAERGENDLNPGEMPLVYYDVNADNSFAPPGEAIQSTRRPTAASGIIDIATTSLEEIRAIVMDVGGTLSGAANTSTLGHPRAIVGGNDDRLLSDAVEAVGLADDASNVLLNGSFDPWTPGDPGDLPFMHAWMRDALPAYSTGLTGDPQTNQRVRAEPLAPDLIETAFASVSDSAYYYADQIAVTGNILLPRCTEFRVEWTFGRVDGNGALVWHDLADRYNDNDGNEAFLVTTRSGTGATVTEVVPDELIHLPTADQASTELFSYFGYSDPTYQPPSAEFPPSREWPWPTALRITASFGDALDPTITESTQFIIEVPQQ